MPEHIPFPEIQQFRNTIRTVRERAEHDGVPLPVLRFIGSVKLHGTNSSIVFPETGGFYCQARTHVITPEQDNAGFAKWVEANEDLFSHLIGIGVVVYGEWCGQGIQKGVAITQLPKMFVPFAVRVLHESQPERSYWVRTTAVDFYCNQKLKCIYDFPTWEIDIDFSKPEEAQNRLVELTQAVEDESGVYCSEECRDFVNGITEEECEN